LISLAAILNEVDRLVAHDAGGDLLAVVRNEGDLSAARVLTGAAGVLTGA